MKRFLFLLSIFIFLTPFFAKAQKTFQGDHRPSIVGGFHALLPSSSKLFAARMNGVAGGELGFRVPIVEDLFLELGGDLSAFEHKTAPTNLLDERPKMNSYGPYFKAGYQSYLGEIFLFELGVKGGYRIMEFNSPKCDPKGRKRIHQQKGFMVQPNLAFWWDAGDGLRFGADVGLGLSRKSFSTDLICEDMKEAFPSGEGGYRIWNFGFSFSKDLIGSER